jgi:hypothetical protein
MKIKSTHTLALLAAVSTITITGFSLHAADTDIAVLVAVN